jgi:hypothetical protein
MSAPIPAARAPLAERLTGAPVESLSLEKRDRLMADTTQVQEHMEVIGADGVHLGTVDKVEGDRIKLTRADSGSHGDHHHYISAGLIAEAIGDRHD